MSAARIKGITIEIGGDTSKLTSALANVDNAISHTVTNLRDIDRALKFDPTNINLLKDRQNELAFEIGQTKNKLETEKQALDQLKNSEGFVANSQAARDLQTQIDLDTAALKKLEKQAKDSGSVMHQYFEGLGSKLKNIGGSIKDVGDKISAVGQDLTTKVTVPIATAFGAAIKTTADFDAQMSKVKAISGATGDEFEQLRAKAREMGESTKYSAQEAGEAFEYMGMAGWKAEQMMEGIDGILNLAAASGEELGTTSDIVTDALTAFGMSAEEAGRLSDILASAATNANTNVSMMGESFKYVAPVAGAIGYTAEDVAIALGLMANSGIKADMAGTSLRNMFQRLAKPTKESRSAMIGLGLSLADSEGNAYSFREIMDQIRTSFADVTVDLEAYNNALDNLDSALEKGEVSQENYDQLLRAINVDFLGSEGAAKASYAAMLGGTRAMSGLLAIANATEEDYNKLTEAIDHSSDAFAKMADGSVIPLNEALASGEEILETYNGQAEAMAATMQDNLSGDVVELKSKLQELAISFGELIIPIARQVVDKVKEIVDWLNSLDDSHKELIMKIAAVAAAVGPVLMAIGGVVSSIGTIVSAVGALLPVLMGPVGIILAIVAAITALGVAIYLNREAIKEWVQSVLEKINHLSDQIIKFFSELPDKIASAWIKLRDVVLLILGELALKVIEKVIELKTKVTDKFNEIKTGITNKITEVKTGVVNKFNEIKTNIQTAVTNIKDSVLTTFTNIKTKLTDTVSNIKNTIVQGFKSAVDYILSLPGQALSWGADIVNNIAQGIRNAISNVVNAAADIAETIKSYIHFSEPDVGPLSNFHTYMPDMMNEIVKGIYAGIPKIQNAMGQLSASMMPQTSVQTAAGNSSTVVNLNVYGAPGQSIDSLANEIEERIAANVLRRGAAF